MKRRFHRLEGHVLAVMGRFGAVIIFVLGTALFAVAWTRRWDSEAIKNAIEAFAVLAAAAYFAQRWVFGYFITNLTVGISAERTNRDASTDWLAVSVSLKKGDRGTIALHDGQVRFQPLTGGATTVDLTIARLAQVSPVATLPARGGPQEHCQIDWSRRSPDVPFLNITPGEELTFGAVAIVPIGEPCVAEVVLIGRVSASPRAGQWRSSVVSLPV